MSLPDFIIGGAPKSGTTALFKYLSQHPEVYTSDPKEPHFFVKDKKNIEKSLNEYESLFDEKNDEQVACEGSTSYLNSSKVVSKRIKAMVPNLKLIFILRDPIKRSYSDYWFHLMRGGIPAKKSFEECIKEKHWIFNASHYPSNIKNYYKNMGEKNVLVFTTNELKHDPEAVLQEICSNLEIKNNFNFDTKVRHNVTKYPRSVSLVRMFGHLTPGLLSWSAQSDWLRPVRSQVLFSAQTNRPKMKTSVRERLLERFAPEIKETQRLIGRDLSSWLKVEPDS